MRYLVIFFIIIVFVGCKPYKIPQPISCENCLTKINDIYSFKIKEIITDSRCPVDVNCVWQGQVELVISVYENDDFLEDEHLILDGKNLEYNKAIFEKYTFGKKVNGISIYPQKKENEKIELKDYYLEVFVEGQN